MLDAVKRLTARVRALRFHLLLGVGAAAVLAVPAVALGQHSSRAASRAAAAAPSCSYAFYDPKSDATDIKGQQADQLDLVQGTLGLNSADTTFRAVLVIKNLSKSIPAPANYMDYEVYWTNPSGDSGPNAIDVMVSSSGTVSYSDGSLTVVNGNSNYTKSSTSSATGSFGSGPNGKITVNVPLKEMQLKPGQSLTTITGQSADGANPPGLGSVADSDPGKTYKVDQRTCIDTKG